MVAEKSVSTRCEVNLVFCSSEGVSAVVLMSLFVNDVMKSQSMGSAFLNR